MTIEEKIGLTDTRGDQSEVRKQAIQVQLSRLAQLSFTY
jgi:hypothetical protein